MDVYGSERGSVLRSYAGVDPIYIRENSRLPSAEVDQGVSFLSRKSPPAWYKLTRFSNVRYMS